MDGEGYDRIPEPGEQHPGVIRNGNARNAYPGRSHPGDLVSLDLDLVDEGERVSGFALVLSQGNPVEASDLRAIQDHLDAFDLVTGTRRRHRVLAGIGRFEELTLGITHGLYPDVVVPFEKERDAPDVPPRGHGLAPELFCLVPDRRSSLIRVF